MTTPSTPRKAGPLLGTGAQTTWPFTFKVFAATDIAVTIADNLGVETALVYGVDFNVTLNANQETSPGGTVTYPISGAALPVGKRLVIFGNLPYDQPLDLPSGGNFSPLALENQLDRLTMQIQQLRENVGRALQLPVTTDGTLSVQLPQPAPNELIGWDSGGSNLANIPLSDIGTAIAFGSYRYDTFTGNGTTTSFALSEDPAVLANLDVSISGVVQVPGTDYSLLTGNLVFASAPSNGTTILARYGQALTALPDSDQITFVQTGAGAATRTAQNKMRDAVSVKDFGAVGDGIANDATAINKAITAVIAAGGGTVFFPAGQYKCSTRIGTFVSAEDVTLWGYGAEIQHFAGSSIQGLMQFGNAALDVNGMYSASTITVKNLNILGLKFTSSDVFNGAIPGRWSDQMPISINTAEDVLIRDCYFENWDFAAIDFGAICRNALVTACTFYSSQVDAGHANYGVRAFCYANYTSYSNGNGDLSPTDPNTGVLKAGYSYHNYNDPLWGHDGISVTHCYFENVSHGVMLSAARRGVVSNNNFKNMSTRSISLTTYSVDYLCSDNMHSLDTTIQTSTGVSVFYGLGQGTFRHQIQDDKFTVLGTINAPGFSPIKCYVNSHDWVIRDCHFEIPEWNATGATCIGLGANSDGEIRDNHFLCANVSHPVTILPTENTASPGYQQGKIWIVGNIFEEFNTGPIQVWDTTSTPEPIVIKDNIVHGNPTRFVAANFTAAGKVAKLFLDGNKFMGSPVRYIDNIVTANKAILLHRDVLEIESFLTTGGGVANPSTTAVSFDFSAYSLPACFNNGQKMYDFTTYGNRANGQASTDFFFRITGETSTSVSGEIVRNAGASFQIGQVALTVRFFGLVT